MRSALAISLALVCLIQGFASPSAKILPAQRVYVTQHWVGAPPRIDGVLNEAGWNQGTWAGDFIQREPIEGGNPTYPTEVKILYDDRALYVAIRCTDPEVATRRRLLASPEEFVGDMVGISLDTYHTRSTSYEFNVTSGGSKIDLVKGNRGGGDMSWRAVWDCKVGYGPDYWVAEYAIPLSQLRYIPGDSQTWGMHVWRWVDSIREETNWSLIPIDHPGFVRSFGELRGIGKLPSPRHLELIPYSVINYRTRLPEAGNPLIRNQETRFDAGLDAKYSVTSNLTLDATINPDFGQVEADPSEINLSTVEIFRKEQRPFFLEGKSLFDFRLDDDWAFYSRRIGAAPPIDTDDAVYSLRPDTSRILGSLKLTGRTEHGLGLGVLGATTERTYATVSDGRESSDTLINPRTHYLVARGVQDLQGGDLVLGGILTGTWRDGTFGELHQLVSSATTVGGEAIKYWGGHNYFAEVRVLRTTLQGSASAITEKMREWVHNFQRVDAAHLSVDEKRTELIGDAGNIRFGKESGGEWRYWTGVTWRSPGVDMNDVGYLGQADSITPNVRLDYVTSKIGRWLKWRVHSLRLRETYDYDGLLTGRSAYLVNETKTRSNVFTWSQVGLRFNRMDTRILRGGPTLRLGENGQANFYIESDDSKPWQAKLSLNGSQSLRSSGNYAEFEPELVYRPTDRFRIETGFKFSLNRQPHQYVSDPNFGSEQGWVMGRMHQRTLSGTVRLGYTFSPTLSLSLYAGPYTSEGRYSEFKRVVNPYASRLSDRFRSIDAKLKNGVYSGSDDGASFHFDNPDFTWRELKSNLVLRWEYRPGSSITFVWSQNRSDDAEAGSFEPIDQYRQLFSVKPENVLMIKASYWFSI